MRKHFWTGKNGRREERYDDAGNFGSGGCFSGGAFRPVSGDGDPAEQKEQFEREQKALQSRYEEREAKQEAGFQAQRQEQEILKRALFTASANVDLYVQLAEKEAETLSMKEKLRVIRRKTGRFWRNCMGNLKKTLRFSFHCAIVLLIT